MTNFIINEAKQMLRFQKTVILLILKAIAYTLRYGLWVLPWVFFFVFVARRMVFGRAEPRGGGWAAATGHVFAADASGEAETRAGLG